MESLIKEIFFKRNKKVVVIFRENTKSISWIEGEQEV
jgi:hypothetical protein